jgi:hypothetical protein
VRAAINDERILVIFASGGIAENTVRLFSCNRLRNVLVAPRRPQIVHGVLVLARKKLSRLPKKFSTCHGVKSRSLGAAGKKSAQKEMQKSGVRRVAGPGCGFRGSGHGGGFCAIDEIFQFLAGLEERDALCRNFYFFSGLGVASDAATALAGAKTSKAANLNLLAFLNGFDDAVENSFDNGLGFLSRKLGDLQYFFDQIRLGQRRLLGHRGHASLQSPR